MYHFPSPRSSKHSSTRESSSTSEPEPSSPSSQIPTTQNPTTPIEATNKSNSEGKSDFGHGRYSTRSRDIPRCSMKYFGQWKTRMMTFMEQKDSKMFNIVQNGDYVPLKGGETDEETKPT